MQIIMILNGISNQRFLMSFKKQRGNKKLIFNSQ